MVADRRRTDLGGRAADGREPARRRRPRRGPQRGRDLLEARRRALPRAAAARRRTRRADDGATSCAGSPAVEEDEPTELLKRCANPGAQAGARGAAVGVEGRPAVSLKPDCRRSRPAWTPGKSPRSPPPPSGRARSARNGCSPAQTRCTWSRRRTNNAACAACSPPWSPTSPPARSSAPRRPAVRSTRRCCSRWTRRRTSRRCRTSTRSPRPAPGRACSCSRSCRTSARPPTAGAKTAPRRSSPTTAPACSAQGIGDRATLDYLRQTLGEEEIDRISTHRQSPLATGSRTYSSEFRALAAPAPRPPSRHQHRPADLRAPAARLGQPAPLVRQPRTTPTRQRRRPPQPTPSARRRRAPRASSAPPRAQREGERGSGEPADPARDPGASAGLASRSAPRPRRGGWVCSAWPGFSPRPAWASKPLAGFPLAGARLRQPAPRPITGLVKPHQPPHGRRQR